MPQYRYFNPLTTAPPEAIRQRSAQQFRVQAEGFVMEREARRQQEAQRLAQEQAAREQQAAMEQAQRDQSAAMFRQQAEPLAESQVIQPQREADALRFRTAAMGKIKEFQGLAEGLTKAGKDIRNQASPDASPRPPQVVDDWKPKIIRAGSLGFVRQYPDGRIEPATKEEVQQAISAGPLGTMGTLEKRSGRGPFESILPGPVLETVGKTPIIGKSLENVTRGVTSPVGLATLPIGGVSGTAAKALGTSLVGSVLGGTTAAEIGGEKWRTLGEIGGGVGGPFAPGAARRLGRTRLGQEVIEDARLAPERGGARVPPEGVEAAPAARPGRFVAPLRDFAEVEREVVTSENPLVRGAIGRTGINPSIRESSRIERNLTAYERQRVAAEELTETAVTAALDVHAQRFTGRVAVPIAQDGTIQGLRAPEGQSRVWQDVFSRHRLYDLPSNQKAYVNDFLQVIDEAEGMRIQAGLTEMPKSQDGWFYVPRQVKGVRGVEIRRPSTPRLQRVYELAEEGWAKGVRYDTDPRATLELHLKAAYEEVALKQLSDANELYSLTAKELLQKTNPAVVTRMEAAIKARQAAERARRALTVSREVPSPEAQALRGKSVRRGEGFEFVPGKMTAKQRAATAKLEAARKEYTTAKSAYSRAMEATRKREVAPGGIFGKAEENISISTWRNRFLPREDVEALTKKMGSFARSPEEVSAIASGFEKTGNAIRFLSSVGDFAAPLIQGLPVLARNPVAWARATANHYYAWFDPTVQSRYIRDNIDLVQDMARHGTPIGDPEFFAFAREGGGISAGAPLEALPGGRAVRGAARTVGRQTFGRFQSSYNTFLGMSRVELAKGMRAGFKGDDASMWSTIRNMTGGLNTRALGVGPSQRGIESVWLAFSPRLLRSTTALMTDALRPGTQQGREALRSLASMAAGATGIYVATGYALGKSEEEIKQGLNPLKGKRFLSYNINGDWIGVGGQVRAISQAIATIAADPKGLLDRNISDNPLIAAYYSRGAPGVNLAGGIAELVTGQDVLPYEQIDSPPDLLKHIGTSALPFALQGVLEGQGKAANIAGEVGARTSPGTLGETLAKEWNARPDLVESMGEWNAADATQWKVAEADPEMSKRITAMRAQGLSRGTEGAVRADELTKLRAEIEKDLKLPTIAENLLADKGGAGPAFVSTWDNYQTQMTGAFAKAYFGKTPDKAASKQEAAYQKWADIKPNDFRDSETSQIDWAAYGQAKDAAFDNLPVPLKTAIEGAIRSQDPSVQRAEAQYKQIQVLREGYYNISKYKGLNAEDGEQLDQLKSVIGLMQTEKPNMSDGIALSRVRKDFDPKIVAYYRRYYGARSPYAVGARPDPQDPARDKFLMAHTDLLRFYPELGRSLSNAQKRKLPRDILLGLYDPEVSRLAR